MINDIFSQRNCWFTQEDEFWQLLFCYEFQSQKCISRWQIESNIFRDIYKMDFVFYIFLEKEMKYLILSKVVKSFKRYKVQISFDTLCQMPKEVLFLTAKININFQLSSFCGKKVLTRIHLVLVYNLCWAHFSSWMHF